MSEQNPLDELYHDQVKEDYPELGDNFEVFFVGNGVETMEGDVSDLERDFMDAKDEGHFDDGALQEAIEKNTISYQAPKGCMLVGAKVEGQELPVLLTIKKKSG